VAPTESAYLHPCYDPFPSSNVFRNHGLDGEDLKPGARFTD
jgi:hypothetical protein